VRILNRFPIDRSKEAHYNPSEYYLYLIGYISSSAKPNRKVSVIHPLCEHELHDRLIVRDSQFQEESLKLREVTRKVIASLKKKSGYIVKVTEDPALPTLATIRIARGNIPAHILSYKPGAKNESPDFVICWQCVFTLADV
jgi:hypothetical protein